MNEMAVMLLIQVNESTTYLDLEELGSVKLCLILADAPSLIAKTP
jgi:hypothetical protein